MGRESEPNHSCMLREGGVVGQAKCGSN